MEYVCRCNVELHTTVEREGMHGSTRVPRCASSRHYGAAQCSISAATPTLPAAAVRCNRMRACIAPGCDARQ
eukprot:6190489-Pleurochrysis_carterae.AAC.1